jgi:hypothetical protein
MGEEDLRERRVKGEEFKDAAEDAAEVDKDEKDKAEMVKQDEAPINGEDVSQVRTEFKRALKLSNLATVSIWKIAEKHLYEKPEKRDVMTDINPEGKYDEDVNVGNVNNRVDENNAENLSSQSIRTPLGEPVTKSFGDTAFENIHNKDPGKDKVHEKPEKRDVVVEINPRASTTRRRLRRNNCTRSLRRGT